MTKLSKIATIVIVSLISIFVGSQIPSSNNTSQYHVLEVLDGDSFVIDKAQKVRLLSIDSPELELCNGQESKEYLESLIKDKPVVLDEIVVDSYRRIVALVYVDGILVNEAMAKAGMVKYNSIDSSQKDSIVAAENYAQENKLGIYSEKCSQTDTNPDNPQCNIKGNISRDSGGIYSFPGCSSYTNTKIEKFLGDQWFCSEKEAQAAGFKRSETCYDLQYQKPE